MEETPNPSFGIQGTPKLSVGSSFGLNCKVLPDWLRTSSRDKAVQSGQEGGLSDVAKFMASHADHESQSRRTAQPTPDRPHNVSYLYALDNGLQFGLNINLSTFIAPTPVSLYLSGGQRRYYVDSTSVPSKFKSIVKKRACIEDKEQGKRWIEVPRRVTPTGALAMPLLVLVADKGPKNWTALQYLSSETSLRCVVFPDCFHEDWNALKRALHAENLFALVLERILLHNLPSGPWEGCAAYQGIRAAGAQYFESAGPGDELFDFLYPRVALAMSSLDLDQVGSPQHMQQVWQQCQAAPVMRRKGPGVRVGRWYDLFKKESQLPPGHWEVLLLILTYMGILERCWPSVWESPLVKTFGSKAPLEDYKAVSDEAQPPPEQSSSTAKAGRIKQSSSGLSALRKGAKNSKEVAVRILGNESRCRLWRCMQYVIRPFCDSFGRWQVACHTPSGGEHQIMQWASGQHLVEFAKIWHRLQEGEGFHALGFMPCSIDDTAESLQVEVGEDEYMAQKMIDLTCRTLSERMLMTQQYAWSLPGSLVLLCSADATVVKNALQRMRRLWGFVTDGAARARTDAFAKSTLDAMLWTRNQFVLEVFVMLAEADFDAVPAEVLHPLRCMFRGLLTTNICEEAMGVLRGREEANAQGQLSCKSRWHSLNSCSLMGEYGRKMPPQSAASIQAAANKLPQATFHPSAEHCSLDSKAFAGITSGKFVGRNAYHWNMGAYATQALERVSGDWLHLSQCWLSLCFGKGTVIKQSGAQSQSYFVMDVTMWGLVVWKVSPVRHPHGNYFQLAEAVGDIEVCSLMPVHDLKKWHVWVTKALPPCKKPARNTLPSGILLVSAQSEGMAPLKFAARHGFCNFTLQQLSQLWVHTGQSARLPSKKEEVIRALVKKFGGELSEAEIDHIVGSKGLGSSPADPVSTSVFEEDPACLDAADEFMHEEDRHEIAPVLQKLRVKSKAVAAASAASTAPGTGIAESVSASSSSAAASTTTLANASGGEGSALAVAESSAAPRKKAAPQLARMSMQDARQYIPQAKGCSLQRESTWHHRICASYLRRTSPGPKYHKRTYKDDEGSEEAALRQCVLWLWALHEEQTGQSCPWEF